MDELPVVIIGAGPAGLAAAAHAQRRGLPVVVLEAGGRAGAGVREWGHIRMFSPWSQLVDPAAQTLLTAAGWAGPEPGGHPTGRDWAERYLHPLAYALDATVLASVRYDAQVIGVARRGRDPMVDAGRESEPFTVQVRTAGGVRRLLARAVIDASGTWAGPNPLGGDGLPALGESRAAAASAITYRVPDLRDPAVRASYAGRHVAVAGTGASAQNTLVELAALAAQEPHTRITWLVRRQTASGAFGGGDNDPLAARGALGGRARQAVDSAAVTTVLGFRTAEVEMADDGTLAVTSFDGQTVTGVDRVVAVTGFRPDLSMLSEVRLDLDPVLQAPTALAPLIDPNVHSCGTVYPHGAKELTQPEARLFLVGMKSYGRAPSFLALTGYEQVRSVVASLAGDDEAAGRVDLTLPETGVCGGSGRFDEPDPAQSAGGCCGSPASEPLVLLGTGPDA